MPNRVEPALFIGKTFTRRKTFLNTVDDDEVMIDGLPAGRILRRTLSFQRQTWFWALTGPYLPPTSQASSGERQTLDHAQEFKAAFWKWHGWALTQTGGAIWHGAGQ